MSHNVEYAIKQIEEKLIGAKILSATANESGEYFGIIVQKGRKQLIVWIDSDEEGNSCGAIKIEEKK